MRCACVSRDISAPFTIFFISVSLLKKLSLSIPNTCVSHCVYIVARLPAQALDVFITLMGTFFHVKRDYLLEIKCHILLATVNVL